MRQSKEHPFKVTIDDLNEPYETISLFVPSMCFLSGVALGAALVLLYLGSV